MVITKNNNAERFELRSSLAYLVQNNAISKGQGDQLEEIKELGKFNTELLSLLRGKDKTLLCNYLRSTGRWKEASELCDDRALRNSDLETRLKGQVRIRLAVDKIDLVTSRGNHGDSVHNLIDVEQLVSSVNSPIPNVIKKKRRKMRFPFFRCFRPKQIPDIDEDETSSKRLANKAANLCISHYEEIMNIYFDKLVEFIEANMGLLLVSISRCGQDDIDLLATSRSQEDSGYEADSSYGEHNHMKDYKLSEITDILKKDGFSMVVLCPRLCDLDNLMKPKKIPDYNSQVKLKFDVDEEDEKIARSELST